MTWQRIHNLAHIHSTWLDVFCEHWQDEQGQLLEYWRVEKADSIIVLPLWQNKLLLPPPFFRVGVNQLTSDFPGGRALADKTLTEAAGDILTRELNLPHAAIKTLTLLNPKGWFINSAFSNQKLYGFVAELHPTESLSQAHVAQRVANTLTGIHELLTQLDCAQCRLVLLEWLNTQF